MRVYLILRRMPHHAARSGYDLLARHVAATPWSDDLLFRLTARIGSRRLARCKAIGTPWYTVESLRRELAICARAALCPANTVYHWLYAENDVRVAPSWRWRWNNRFVASFHQPPEYLANHVADPTHVRGLDGVVVVSRSQIPFFARLVSPQRVHHVPHGVDTEHWQPSAAADRHATPTFLFVGAWLRDIEMAKATILRCAAERLPACFRVVTTREHVATFAGAPATTVMTGISDAQLLEEYQRAHALFLPLTMATANNAILESMACGTGIISTRTGGTPEYVAPDCGVLVPPADVEAAVSAITRACANRDFVEAMGAAARRQALTFAWPRVGALQDAVYARIARGDAAEA